jgi:hypothetical protein
MLTRRQALLVVAASLLVALGGAAFRRWRASRVDPVARAALEVVVAARSPAGLGAELVDADVVEQVRRIQLVQRTTMDTRQAPALLRALDGDAGPDRQYPPSDRPQKQRERATRGLRDGLSGPCRAARWDTGRDRRVRHLVEPLENVPAAVTEAQSRLARALDGAELARVTCEKSGDVGMLFVPRDGRLRLVDVWALGHSTVEVNPNEPTMK